MGKNTDSLKAFPVVVILDTLGYINSTQSKDQQTGIDRMVGYS